MGHGMVADLDADVATTHFLRHGGRGAGAEEGVKNEVAGVCGDIEQTLNELLGFNCRKYIIRKT